MERPLAQPIVPALGYATSLKRGRRRLRSALLAGAIVLAVGCTWRPLARAVQPLYLEWRFSRYFPAGTVLFDSDPAASAVQSGFPMQSLSPAGPALRNAVGSGARVWFLDARCCLMRRRTPSGKELLLCGGAGYADQSSPEYPNWCVLGIFIAAGAPPSFGSEGGPPGEARRLSINLRRADRFMLYAAEPDPRDASHLRLRFRCNGAPGIIDGWLQNDGAVKFSSRDGIITEFHAPTSYVFVPAGVSIPHMPTPPARGISTLPPSGAIFSSPRN